MRGHAGSAIPSKTSASMDIVHRDGRVRSSGEARNVVLLAQVGQEVEGSGGSRGRGVSADRRVFALSVRRHTRYGSSHSKGGLKENVKRNATRYHRRDEAGRQLRVRRYCPLRLQRVQTSRWTGVDALGKIRRTASS